VRVERFAMGPQHVVLIIGGGVSGSEVALQLARRGIHCVVIDQNQRPYGKIEDGLPRWHAHLRRQEMGKIDQRLDHPGVHFVPRTKLGRDTDLRQLLGWGPSALVLAVGAWRDRPLPVPGVDGYAGRGFYYQNPFVYWFNHYPEPGYRGPQVELADGALVVGGGLASLDVVKMLMLETVARALTARGHVVDLYDMERRGISAALTERGLTLADLGLRGCTLTYRRGVEDMPVAEVPEDSAPEHTERVRATRRKLMHKFLERYLCGFRDHRAPVGLLTDGGRLGGLRLAATEVRGGHVFTLPGTEEDVASRLTVSSVGSIPEPLDGIPMDGDLPGDMGTNRVNERIRNRLDRLRLPDVGPAATETRHGLEAMMNGGRDNSLPDGPFEKPNNPARPLVDFVPTKAQVNHSLTNGLQF
jgi:hypothetical protein